jgi:two-component system chemotaxis response regulator CheY
MPSGFHFLVVDDLAAIRYVVTHMLKALGHANVSEAEDGAKALQLLQAADAVGAPVDFVLTDWNMPGMSGIALLRSIRCSARLAHLPVLMITAEAEAGNIAAATKAGVDGYIVKPFLNAGTLKETLDSILRKKGLMA